jgi:hypothetical protein
MKKLIAIFFLSLLCLTIVPGGTRLWDAIYEQGTENEDNVKVNKESKKEVKEFKITTHKKAYTALAFINCYKANETIIFPRPVLDKRTPPPDQTC